MRSARQAPRSDLEGEPCYRLAHRVPRRVSALCRAIRVSPVEQGLMNESGVHAER